METRIIRTHFWEDDAVVKLNVDTRLTYLCLLSNSKIGQLRIYELSDRQLSFFTGFNLEALAICKRQLEEAKLAYFFDGYICLTGRAYVESAYSGEKNRIARQKQINLIPESVLDHFNTILDTLSIGYRYSIDTSLNLNNKSKSKSEPKSQEDKWRVAKCDDVWEETENGAVLFKQ